MNESTVGMWLCSFVRPLLRTLTEKVKLRGSGYDQTNFCPGSRFLKAPEYFWACEAIFSSFVSKNGEVYTPETFL